ncbi:MAG: alpha-amylase family glycosyl hydrolase [Kiritimatiellia bacterium]
MNHYQVNLRSISCQAPANPLEALKESAKSPEKEAPPLAVLTRDLELLSDLGIELLHIMPPFLMGKEKRKGIGSPYAVADYDRMDPEFGDKPEWFSLVRKAHQLGMKVILGFMPNHTARDHKWIQEDPGYYVKGPDGSPGYDFDWSDTAKLNYTHPALRKKVTDTLLYWLEGEDADSGVDGYRMDMAHMINDLSFWDEVIPELEQKATRPLLLLAECYGLERNLDLFVRGFHSAYDDDFYKIAQYGFARDLQGNSRLVLDEEAEKNEDFAPRLTEWRKGGIAAAVQGLIQEYQVRAPDKLLARYVDNHDEGRGVYRFGPQASRVMMDLAACMPQSILFTLAGQEAGAMNRPPIHEYFSICDKGFRQIHEDRIRKIEGIEFEGNQFFRTSEARRQAVSEARKRFSLRKEHPCLVSGNYLPLDVQENSPDTEKTVVAFTRQLAGESLHCLFNLGHEARNLGRIPEGTLIAGSCENATLEPFGWTLIQAPGADPRKKV